MTPTEQDKELREAILLEFKQVHKLAPADYTENCTNVVMSIIRTEKLKLLDELEAKAQEYVVIGEQLRGFPYFITVDNIKAERNKLEAEL